MTRRQRIYEKYNGLCAYSGTPLEDDWQIDHIKPIIRNLDGSLRFPKDHNEDNMVPVQKIINHYKGSLDLETFRRWFLGELHLRLAKLPKNPYVKKSIKRKEYVLKVAEYFGITENKAFDKVFYFEKEESQDQQTKTT